jgi:hypothetical protein
MHKIIFNKFINNNFILKFILEWNLYLNSFKAI